MATKKPAKSKKPAKISTRKATPAELHEAARVARRSGEPADVVSKLQDDARDAERAAGLA